MSNGINSLAGPRHSPPLATSPTARQTLGSFELNAKQFGPLAANLIGVAQAAGQGASSVCSLSKQGLDELGRAAQTVYDGAAQAVQTVEDAVSSTAASIGDMASSAASYAALGVAAGAALINEIA